ncbi:hypothetical protein B7463_g12344, partial [Scytalidium lignicola]
MNQIGQYQRGSLAAQTCETCRSRKRKCEETRPKCSLCKRLRVNCQYKDRNTERKKEPLSEILSLLRQVNSNVEHIVLNGQNDLGTSQQQQHSIINSYCDLNDRPSTAPQPHISNIDVISREDDASLSVPYRHSTAAHTLLEWPFIHRKLQDLPTSSDIYPCRTGIDWFLFIQHQQINHKPLATELSMTTTNLVDILHEVPYASIVLWINMYFDTFNFIHPLLDRPLFFQETLPMALNTNTVVKTTEVAEKSTILTLLVIALGDKWYDRPPGLKYFNESRRRLGFVETGYSLEVVQIQALTSLYYSACFHHVEAWRMSVQASATCYLLVKSHHHDWDTTEGDLLKQAFWHCVAVEVGHHLELNLPYTSIMDLEQSVPLPSFLGPYCERDQRANDISQFHHHYAALVTLRRICRAFHTSVEDVLKGGEVNDTNEPFKADGLASIIRESARQLQQWRNMLPSWLRWNDDGRTIVNGRVLFITKPDNKDRDTLNAYKYTHDIQVAMLRTRYYYAQYMIYRPLVYKALHFPTRMTAQDVYDVSVCLKCCLNWPMTFAPNKGQKPLVPYLFCWSQNFLGILLVFYYAQESPLLQSIRKEYLDENDISQSLGLMRDWIRDLKDVDGLAEWSWHVIETLFQKQKLMTE